jgi:anaerobic selenocysteine-containing dehydrogenase
MLSTKRFEVAEVQPDDPVKNKALMDPEEMKSAGIKKGDLVTIEGRTIS